MLLRSLQTLIENLYDLGPHGDVQDFLVTDRALLPAAVDEGAEEQLLVAREPQDGSVAMSLFLDARLLDRLERRDPRRELNGGNVADYLTALEGVSHFVCVAWHARHERPVSILHLEMQAEIDKYLATCHVLRSQEPDRFPAELHRLLFARARVAPQLAGDREQLYGTASRHAAKFCLDMERRLRHVWRQRDFAGLPELCRFYRLPDASKLAYVETL